MQTLQDLTERVRAAASTSTPLRICGGGSKDFYGQSLQGERLDTRGLTGIVSYEPSELVVTVRAGTPLAELEAVLADKGQYLPFEPPHFADQQFLFATFAPGLNCGILVDAQFVSPEQQELRHHHIAL